MKTQNRAHISVQAAAAAVVLAFLLLLSAPFISADLSASGASGGSGMSSGDAVSAAVSLDIISPLNATCKSAEQSGLSQAPRSFKHWLYSLQLSLVMVLSFAIFKTRGLSCHFSKAVIRTSPISISIGGHAPPFFCA